MYAVEVRRKVHSTTYDYPGSAFEKSILGELVLHHNTYTIKPSRVRNPYIYQYI